MIEMSPAKESSLAELQKQLAAERVARLKAETRAATALQGLRRREKEALLLLAIAQLTNDAANTEAVLLTSLRQICEHSGWVAGQVYRLDYRPEPGWHLSPAPHCTVPARLAHVLEVFRHLPPGQQARHLPVDGCEGRAVWFRDFDALPHFPAAAEARRAGLTGVGYFPVMVKDKIVAMFEFFSDLPEAPDHTLLELLAQLDQLIGNSLERLQVHLELERREEYFRRLTENALDLITILNADGTIRYESPSIQQVLGYKPEDYLGHNAFEFVHPDDVPMVGQAFAEALGRHGNTPPLIFRFRHKDGSYRFLEGIGNNLLGDPVVAGIVFNSRDITERKRLEEQFLQSQKVQALGQLAGGVAHDFNNILTAIIGYSDLILREMPETNPLHDNAKDIRKAADRAASLTRQLLAFSRRQVLQPIVLNMNEVVADMDRMLRRLLKGGVKLTTVGHAEIGMVKADPNQIEQVILNLVVNARDALPQGGHIIVETDNVHLAENHFHEVPAGEYVLLTVSDNGTGMTPEVKARLFEPFFTTKEKGQGTGLGLATCMGIIKQSGGHVSVYSEPGQGTTFKVYLPRVHELQEEKAEATPAPKAPDGSARLLLVEDEPMLRDLAEIVLRDLGYDVITAANGREALELVEKNPEMKLDLMVTDVVMPEMGGPELADHILKIRPQTRILFTSGFTEDAIVQTGKLDEGIDFIQKPYSVDSLGQKVHRILQVPMSSAA